MNTASIERFWALVDRGEGCWLWRGRRSPNGYGRFYLPKTRAYAHRVSYELAIGPVAPGMFVCHRCDVPLCVRPEHLFLGTAKDNMRDMWRKGRGKPGAAVGELSGHAKLTWALVRELRAQYTGQRGELAAFARRHGISIQAVCSIIKGKTWREVTS